jgi:hypothetical protein
MLNEFSYIKNFAVASIFIVGIWQPISLKFHGRTQSAVRAFLLSFFLVPCPVSVGLGGGVMPSAAFMLGAFVLNGLRAPLAMLVISKQCAIAILIPFAVFFIAFEVWRTKMVSRGISPNIQPAAPRKIELGRKLWMIFLFGLIVAILKILK